MNLRNLEVKRVKACIRLMKQADEHQSLYMPAFQKPANNDYDALCTTMNSFHKCGNKACFAGHVALSQAFKRDGGEVGTSGEPVYSNHFGYTAIAMWLGIPFDLASAFVLGSAMGAPNRGYSDFYLKQWDKVQPMDVIKKLQWLLDEHKEQTK